MKKNLILSITIGALLVLTSCGNTYGDFEMVAEKEKEDTYNQVKKLNEDTDDIDAYEETYTITGTTGEGDETEEIEASYISRAAIVDGYYESDEIAENSEIGSFTSYTRYVEKSEKYMTYSYLKFVNDENTDSLEEKIYSYSYECVELNFDTNLTINAKTFSSDYKSLRFMTDIDFDDSIELYKSSKGYFRVEITDGDNVTKTTINPEGAPVEVYTKFGTQMSQKNINYTEKLEDISTEKYSEPSSRELVLFYASVMAFGLAAFGVFASLII